jgi:parallel beta-helix repeat protein
MLMDIRFVVVVLVAGVVLAAYASGIGIDDVVEFIPDLPDIPGLGGNDDGIEARFIVTVSAGTYTAKASDGTVLTSGTSAATVIQKALDSVSGSSTEKVLLKGDLVLGEQLEPKSNTIIELDGKITTSAASKSGMVYASGKDHITIQGGEWDNNMLHTVYSSTGAATGEKVNADGNPNGGGARGAFIIKSSQNIVIKDLKVHSSPYGNVLMASCSQCTIKNVESYDTGDMYTTVEAKRGASMTLSYCSNFVVEDCHIYDSARGGVYFYTHDEGTVQHIDNNVFKNNKVERTECSGLSFSLRGTEDVCSGGSIIGNTLVDCGMDGAHPMINVGYQDSSGNRYAKGVTVKDNHCSESGNYHASKGSNFGINFCVNNGVVSNNEIRKTTDYGLCVRGNGNVVEGNIMDQPKTSWTPALVLIDADENTVKNNKIYARSGSSSQDSLVLMSGCSKNTISGNYIENSARYAIDIQASSCSGNVVTNNDLSGSGTIRNLGTNTVLEGNH